jgi:protein involved in polysaccharide export with SLBB domain
MKKITSFILSLIFLFSFSTAAAFCQENESAPPDDGKKQYFIRQNDTLDVLIPLNLDVELLNKLSLVSYQLEIFGNELFTKKTITVDPYGYIYLPLAGSIRAEGRTTEEIAQTIISRLKKYIQNVRCEVMVSRFAPYYIYIFGEVNKPDKYEIPKEVTAFEAIAIGGGFTKFADKKKVKVVRKSNNLYMVYTINLQEAIKKDRLEENILLKNNDIIIVEESFF